MKYFLFVLLLILPLASFADDYEPKDVSELQAQYNLLVDLRNDKEISESTFREKTEYLKQLATDKFHINIEGLRLQQMVPAQKIDWIGSAFYVISALLVLLLLAPLLRKLVKPLAKLVKRIATFFAKNKVFQLIVHYSLQFIYRTWEILSYLILGFLLYYFNNEFIVLQVSFLSGSLVSFSIYSRRNKEKRELYSNIASWSLTILWATIAYLFDNGFVGFMTVASFISSIGFAMFMFPGMVGIGFKKNNAPFVLRLTAITFFLSLFSWLLFYTNYITALAPLKDAMRPFEVGMVSLIPLVYFLGLGYMTFFLYRNKLGLKILCELIALVSGLFVLTIALLYGIGSMFWIGLLFMTWNAIDKYHELVYKRVDFVWAGLILAGILGGTGYLIKSNIALIMQYLEFLNL